MTDSVLIQNGGARQIWRNTTKTEVPPLHPDLVACIVEVESDTVNENDAWDGEQFIPAGGG